MLTDNKHSKPVIVLAATNRPYDVDGAVLRRLPRAFEIGLPNYNSRIDILHLFLKRQPMTEEARALIPKIAKYTEGYSGSDLKELCRAAAMEPIREISASVSRQHVMGNVSATESNDGNSESESGEAADETPGPSQQNVTIRPVSNQDFLTALQRVKRTGDAARTYRRKESGASESSMGGVVDLNDLSRLLQNMLSQSSFSIGDRPSFGAAGAVEAENDDVPDIRV